MKKRLETVSKPDQWAVVFLDELVEQEFDAFSIPIQAKFDRKFALIEELGLPTVGAPHVKQVEGKLWEIVAQDADHWARVFYCAWVGKRVVLLHGFVKKTNKTPRREIEVAKERLKKLSMKN